MIATDEDALICDLAEVYHIFDYESLPIDMVATFSLGLRADSRIKQKMRGDKIPLDIKLLSLILDDLSMLIWSRSKDGAKGINRPVSVYQQLTSDFEKQDHIDSFRTPSDFEEERQRIINRAKGG